MTTSAEIQRQNSPAANKMSGDATERAKPDRLERARLEKLVQIESLGIDPWGHRFDGHIAIERARRLCPQQPGVDGDHVRVAGRIMLRNNKGKLKFFHMQDSSGRIQLMASKRDLSAQQWELIGALDLGDIVGVDGVVRKTNTGEVSIFVEELTMLCKSLAQPPEKFHGVRDVEMLLRRRYIDLIYNEGVLERLLRRSKIVESIRRTLVEQGYVDVETPVLHAIAGGAAARPFVTHHNALDIDLYLRIALELHLKRLLVGGIERVYEIGRVFRNEGIDSTHNPEFTMLEAYQAYGNYETMMELTESIVRDAVQSLGEGMQLPWGDETVDFGGTWPRVKYADLFLEHAGCDMRDAAAVRAQAQQQAELGNISGDFIDALEHDEVHPDVVVNKVFEAAVEPHLAGPIFVIDFPASICPLTKRKPGNPEIAERFELFIQGMEIANAYTELNDPRLQEELFRTQLAGLAEEESMAKMDHDFIRALKVGMPPAGGLGIGVDRLVMLLTNSQSIRDVIFFPLQRPESGTDAKGDGET